MLWFNLKDHWNMYIPWLLPWLIPCLPKDLRRASPDLCAVCSRATELFFFLMWLHLHQTASVFASEFLSVEPFKEFLIFCSSPVSSWVWKICEIRGGLLALFWSSDEKLAQCVTLSQDHRTSAALHWTNWTVQTSCASILSLPQPLVTNPTWIILLPHLGSPPWDPWWP